MRTVGPGREAPMVLLLALIFLLVPIAELAVIITVAGSIGILETVLLLIVVSVVGAWLAKREGFSVLRRIRVALERGQLPDRELADGFLILLAGALMVSPGFLTDLLALVLLFPPTRVPFRAMLMRAVANRGALVVTGGPRGGRRRGGSADVWDAESWEAPPRRGDRDELEGPG